MKFSVNIIILCATLLFLHQCHAAEPDTCSSDPTTAVKQGDEILGFSVFYSRPDDGNAFFQDLRPMISASRAEPGSVDYRMFVNPDQPGAIGFVETWESKMALGKHLQGKAVTSIFGHQYYREIMGKKPDLFGPWYEVLPEEDNESCGDAGIEMVFYWTMNCTRKHVWDIITNWEDASWVKGDPKTTIIPLDADGKVMSEEEAAKVENVDVQGGLGPVVQRRTWANGAFVDVRMLTKDEETFTTLQETLSALVFPEVTFDKFYVNLTLDAEGLDPDTQSRMRYHVKATVKKGTNAKARETLKADFYGPRIDFYQKYFNCTGKLHMKRATNTVRKLHSALAEGGVERETEITKLFAGDAKTTPNEYITRAIGMDTDETAMIDVKLPYKMITTPDLRVVSVEDIVITDRGSTEVASRIVIYQMDEWGRVVSMRVFDKSRSERRKTWIEKKLFRSMNKYFKVLEKRSIKRLRKLYAPKPELHDPVSYVPKRTFDSVYGHFFKLSEFVGITLWDERTFVDVSTKEVAYVVQQDIEFANGNETIVHPVQVLTYDDKYRIQKFEAYFVPSGAVKYPESTSSFY